MVSNCVVDAVPSSAELESHGARWINASTDDVLGLASDPRVREALQGAVRRVGLHRLAASELQQAAEARFAALTGHEAALIATDWRAAVRCLPTWRCAVDGRSRALASDATVVMTPDDAEGVLNGGTLGGLLVEALHPHEGDLAPLPRYAEECARAQVSLVVFDPLGLGVLGQRGAGAAEHLAVNDQVALQVASLGAGLPGVGVVISGTRSLVQALRGQLEAPLTAPLAATLRALEVHAAEPQRRARLFDLTARLLTGLRGRGFDTGPAVTPWVPVWVGDATLCQQWLDGLAEAAIAARAWIAPGSARLLLSLSATTTDAQLTQVLEVFDRLARRMKPRELSKDFPEPPVVARPGSFTLSHPCSAHWLAQPLPSAPAGAPPPAETPLRERVYDAVENLTWRASVVSSKSIRRSTDAVRALFDRRRKGP